MSKPTNLRWRLLRSGIFAALTAQIAVLGHLLGGGSLPDFAAIITVTAALTFAITGLATKRRGFGSILPAMTGAQVIFHLVFSISSHHQESLTTVNMLLFHAVAAVACAALLAHGEKMLFGLFAALRRVLPRLLPVLIVSTTPAWTALTQGRTHIPTTALITLTRPRRGPPVPC